jgi:glutaconate CoA-transferase subunit B
MEPDDSGELVLTALHPEMTVEQARQNTGWPLKVSGSLRVTDPPTDGELRILREELDPMGIYLKGGQ